jgi:cell division protein FtsB
MREFQDKKRIKRLLYSKPAVIILAIAIVFFGNATWGLYKKEKESAANALIAEKELAKLQDRQQLLNSEIDRLHTDAGIEEEIRSKYSVSKSGENVVIIVDKDQNQNVPTQQKEGWWDKFKNLFK